MIRAATFFCCCLVSMRRAVAVMLVGRLVCSSWLWWRSGGSHLAGARSVLFLSYGGGEGHQNITHVKFSYMRCDDLIHPVYRIVSGSDKPNNTCVSCPSLPGPQVVRGKGAFLSGCETLSETYLGGCWTQPENTDTVGCQVRWGVVWCGREGRKENNT